MKTVRRHNGWIVAAVATLSAFAYPVTGAMAEDGRFQKLSVYLERNVQDHDAEIRFEAVGAEDGLAALKVSAPGERTSRRAHIALREQRPKGQACAARRD